MRRGLNEDLRGARVSGSESHGRSITFKAAVVQPALEQMDSNDCESEEEEKDEEREG